MLESRYLVSIVSGADWKENDLVVLIRLSQASISGPSSITIIAPANSRQVVRKSTARHLPQAVVSKDHSGSGRQPSHLGVSAHRSAGRPDPCQDVGPFVVLHARRQAAAGYRDSLRTECIASYCCVEAYLITCVMSTDRCVGYIVGGVRG